MAHGTASGRRARRRAGNVRHCQRQVQLHLMRTDIAFLLALQRRRKAPLRTQQRAAYLLSRIRRQRQLLQRYPQARLPWAYEESHTRLP